MDTTDTDTPEEQTPAPPDPIVGGSYTRDPVTGALTNNNPVQAPAQPDEE